MIVRCLPACQLRLHVLVPYVQRNKYNRVRVNIRLTNHQTFACTLPIEWQRSLLQAQQIPVSFFVQISLMSWLPAPRTCLS